MHHFKKPLRRHDELKVTEPGGDENEEFVRLKPILDKLLDQINNQSVSIYNVWAFSEGPWYYRENIALLCKVLTTFLIQIVISSMIVYHCLNSRAKEGKDFCPMRSYEEHFTAKFTGFCVCVYLYALTEKHTTSSIPSNWTTQLYKKGLAFIPFSDDGPLLARYLHYPSMAQYELIINQFCLWISTVAGYLAIYFLTSSPFDIILNSLAMTFLFEMDELITTPREIRAMHKVVKKLLDDLQNDSEDYAEQEIESVQSSCFIWFYWWLQWIVWNFLLRPVFLLSPVMFMVCY